MRSISVARTAVLALLVTVAACGNGGGNDPLVPVCVNPVAASAAPSWDGASLGATSQIFHASNVKVSTTLTFTVPVNTASLTIVEQAVKAPSKVTFTTNSKTSDVENYAVPFTVTDPNGTKFYDDNQDFSALSSDVSGNPPQIEQLLGYAPAPGAGAGALVVPATTGGLARVSTTGLPAGAWTMVVADLGWECAFFQWPNATCSGGSLESTYDVTVIAKPLVASGIPTSGTVDLTVYFATTTAGPTGAAPLDVNVANAGQDQDLNRMVSSLAGLLAKAGVTLRNTTYVLLPQSVLATYATGVDISTLDACSPLAQLFRNSTSGQTLNVFFVSSFKGADVVSGKTVVGLDGSIPGPATVGGSTGSGVAVSTVDLRFNRSTCTGGLNLSCGADLTAYFIAHEAGHFLGLSHTTELYGYRYDALSDTTRCPCSACRTTNETCATSDASVSSTSHTMTVPECTRSTTCGGGDNLMFWTLSSSASKGNITAEQKKIVLANPQVQ